MIPLTLQLKNFLSYGPIMQTIDFSSYHLICLSGKNGHGKSALLDAITWALWGHARKTSNTAKADQGLLHLGQTHMMTIFDFICNGQHYRIRREYAQTYGKPYAVLEFGLVDPANDLFIPLTDKTIRATQHKIEQTLHLNFEAFTNSAFLRQGNANEFSKKSPKERKEILASILGLDFYETLKKRALEKIRTCAAEKNSLTTLCQKITQELDAEPLIIQEIAAINKEVAQWQGQEQKIKEEHAHIIRKKNKLRMDQKEQELVALQVDQLKTNYDQELATLHRVRQEWRSIEQKRRNLPKIEQVEAEKKRLTHLIHEQQKRIQQRLELKENILKLQEQIQLRKQDLMSKQISSEQEKKGEIETLVAQEKNKVLYRTELTQLEQKLSTEYEQVVKNIAALKEQRENLRTDAAQEQEITARFEKRKDFYHRFIAQGKWHQAELDSLFQKQQLVTHDNDPSCPLCEQNLSTSRKRFLKNKFVAHEQFLRHRIQRLAQVTKKLKEILLTEHTQLQEFKKRNEQQALLTIHSEEQTKIKSKIAQELEQVAAKKKNVDHEREQFKKAITQAQAELQKITQENIHHIEKDTILIPLHTQLLTGQEQIKQLQVSQEEYNQTRKELDAIEEQFSLAIRLTQETSIQKQRIEQIGTLCKTLKKKKQEIAILTERQTAYAQLVTQETELVHQEEQILRAQESCIQEKEKLLQKKGSLEQKKLYIEGLHRDHAQYTTKITELDAISNDYTIIAQATSKDGVQALLIEDAIPEIEQEANLLLAKLTDNQAHLIIESLRDLKKGGTKETLDIKISDAIGIRPYEMFSGGEGFRIDFALRIAISKLLARRAGTALQTLIIDEGFGSQDEEGLAHIMDAIYAIQEDFSKVIIVSHLPAMKEQFPVHFMVEKGAQGSKITVLEQG